MTTRAMRGPRRSTVRSGPPCSWCRRRARSNEARERARLRIVAERGEDSLQLPPLEQPDAVVEHAAAIDQADPELVAIDSARAQVRERRLDHARVRLQRRV